MFLTGHLAAVIAALTACVAATRVDAALPGGQPQPNAASMTCTNPSSGATWQIGIDYEHATVDTHPARISDAEITWRDPKDGWNYKLNRQSGALTVIVASSTGGYFLHDQCRLSP